jgi:hypothetical protein
MSPESSIFLGTIVFVICLFVIFMIAVFAGLAWIISRVMNTRSHINQALAEDTQAYFERSTAQLYPLSANALTDVSSRLDVNGRAALGNVHYRGQLQSLSQPGRGYLDFDLQLKFGKGAMRLNTTQHALQLDFAGIGARQVQAAASGQPFGLILTTSSMKTEIDLCNPQGQIIGHYHRQPLKGLGMAVEPARYNYKVYYGQVEVGGRVLAELNRNPLILRSQSGVVIAPLFRQVAFDLSEEEETWLLLLAGWEIYVKILTR